MVREVGSKGPRGQSERARTSKSVRLDDQRGFDHKFNKTGFKCEAKRHLYYYYVKCYEQVLRGKDASSVLKRPGFSKYQRLAEIRRLKPLPDGFQDFKESVKIEKLSKLFEEQVDAGVGIVQQCEDVNRPGKMEVDESSAADLGPERSISEMSHLDGDSLQSVAQSFQDNPQGRPPTCLGSTEKFQQCVSEFKRRACSYPDIFMEVERWEQQGMTLITKMEDRDICESLGVGSSNTLMGNRQEEILSQLQDMMVKDPPKQFKEPVMEASYSQASNFGTDVERGVENFATTEKDPAIDPLPTASSLIVCPDHSISEALKVTPIYMGRLKANLEEIHPRVAGDLGFPFSTPMMEVSYPQGSDLWDTNQYGGEFSTTISHSGGNSDLWGTNQYGGQFSTTISGGNSASQIVPMGFAAGPDSSAEPLAPNQEFLAEKSWDEPALEGSPSPLWKSFWDSPVRYEP